MRPIVLSQEKVTDSAVRRLLFDAGEDINDLMTLCDADITSKNPEKVKKYLENFQLVRQKLKDVEERDNIRNMQLPITGLDIINHFEIKPGKEVGILKNKVKDAILDGIIPNNKEKAFEFMNGEALKIGLKQKKA